MIDLDAKPTEQEIATATLALRTDLSVTALREIVREARRKRSKKPSTPSSPTLDKQMDKLQKAIIKSTLVHLKSQKDLDTFWVNWWLQNTSTLFTFSIVGDNFACTLNYTSKEARCSSYLWSGGDDPVVWGNEQDPFGTEDRKSSFRFRVDADTYYSEQWRHYRLNLFRDSRFGPSGTIKFTLDKRDNESFHRFEAGGLSEDLSFVADIASDASVVLGYRSSVDTARRFLRTMGLSDETETPTTEGTTT